jgi:DNA uptake protein ComE-like DNA-binding protein
MLSSTKKKTLSFSVVSFVLLLVVGCSQQQAADRDKIKEGAAAATAEVKKDTSAVVEGVKEGWNRDNKGLVNVNSATKAQLLNLPGVTQPTADALINGRPYADKHELVTKGVLSENEYGRISGSISLK